MRTLLLFTILVLSSFSINAQKTDADKTAKLDKVFETVKWRSIGPFRGGRSVCSSGVPNDPLTYYMGTTGGGLWKTEDAGQYWTNISDGYFKTGSVGAIAVADSNPNILYCGMGEHAPRGVMTSYGDGVYKSVDAGETWQHVGLKETQHIARIIIHPTNPDIVFVAAQGALHGNNEERGIFKSIDGGETWDKVLYVNDMTGCAELSMNRSNPMVLYAAMWEHQRKPWKVISGGEGSGLYKSTDGGETWKKIHKGLPKEKGKMAISVCQSNPDKVYALVESDSDKRKGGLFVSNNAGASWSRISKDNRLVQRAWYYLEVFADPSDEQTVYVLSAPALRSIDGGKTWSRLSGTHGDYHDLWINPKNSKNLCIANDGGAAISFNYGKTWSTQANMPTAQFYRINVDNHFPYRIYGGQQDNSSVRIESRSVSGGGIDRTNWTSSAGGESAFLAFDPDDPRYVLGGSYLGTIEVLDTESSASTNIMAAPIQYLGRAARDMKYRFNWNAPIIWSKHEPGTFYHAAQKLLRTRDMGVTWKEVSPDLSNNDDSKLGNGGGPYTNEAVGAENYGTISYVVESPHEKGVIWVATDDGNVQLTKDNCETWTNVRPKGMPECLVNAIDVSPHDPAVAYIACTRYKFNDHSPILYRTADYGKTWVNISAGIPKGAYTRVLREDTGRKGMLFAGTETGVYISWDNGAHWQALQLNLPVTPVNDLMVAHDDVIVATSGRSFWILDDLTLLRQYDATAKKAKLYQPEPVVMSNGYSPLNGNSKSFDGTNPLRGVNPATGAVLYYQLPEVDKKKAVILEIKDAAGNIVRTISTDKDSTYQRWAGGPPSSPRLSKNKGLNRFVWDLRYPNMNGVAGVYIEASYRRHKVSPGTYTATLTHGDQKSTTTIEVKPNPNYITTKEQYDTYDQFMSEVEKELIAMHKMVNDLDAASKQIKSAVKKIPKGEKHDAVRQQAKALLKSIKSWDEDMVQRKTKAYDDVENFPNKFTANYMFMINQTESSLPRVNESSRSRLAELNEQWKPLKETGQKLLKEEVPALSKMLWDAGIGAVYVE